MTTVKKIVTIIIHNCDLCEFSDAHYNDFTNTMVYYCNKVEKSLTIKNMYKIGHIPEWCPLEKAD